MSADRFDVLVGVGVLCLAVGLWMVSPPLALIVMGIILAVAGFYGATNQ